MKTFPTRTLPTDKHGNIYYGPRTAADARRLIADNDAPPGGVVAQLLSAGFGRVAAIIRKEYLA